MDTVKTRIKVVCPNKVDLHCPFFVEQESSADQAAADAERQYVFDPLGRCRMDVHTLPSQDYNAKKIEHTPGGRGKESLGPKSDTGDNGG